MDAKRITATLRGKWFGTYGYVCCVAHEDGHPSLRLRDGERGRLLVRCEAGCDAGDVLAHLRRRGFLDGTSEADDEQQLKKMERRRREHDRRGREAYAREIWHASAAAPGTLVEVYLRGRAITLAAPPTLRYHSGLKHTSTGLIFPAMVAAVQAPDRRITGIHRTYLKADGSDKGAVSEAKLSLGTIARGAVRLAAADRELAVGEGIETTFSFMQEHCIPGWAALSTSGMQSIVLPPLPLAEIVYICTDLDRNHAGEKAAEAAADRFVAEGRKVKIATPVAGKDMNDALREVACGG